EPRVPVLHQGRAAAALAHARRQGAGLGGARGPLPVPGAAGAALAALRARRVPARDRAQAPAGRDRPLPLVLPEVRQLPARGDVRRQRLRRGSGLPGLRQLLRLAGVPHVQEVRHGCAGAMSGAAELLLSVEEQVRPAHAALVIVDLQNDFCAEDGFLSRARAEGGGPKIREEDNVRVAQNIDRLATAARAARMPVVWLRSIYDFKYLAPAHIAKRGGKEGLCMEGSWGADFFRIRPQPGDLVVDKHTFSGFHQTRLHEALQAQGVKTLVFTGVATNVCVDSTLREG